MIKELETQSIRARMARIVTEVYGICYVMMSGAGSGDLV
jgi:hypothetical protein